MISGANSIYAVDNDVIASMSDPSGPIDMNSIIGNLKKRRDNIINGGVNCIPLKFNRFRQEVPGIEKSQYVVITANEKTGKTQIASFIYLYSSLEYAFEHKDQCSVHIIYFALEESISKIKERYMCYLLYMLDGKRISPTDLRSTSAEYPIPEDILALLETERYQERLRFFDECVQFETENTNPTGILRVCENYMKSVGKYNTHKTKSKSDPSREVDVFDSYVQNDPNHYVIGIIDHIGLADKEQGFNTKATLDKVSEYAVKYMRNRYGMTFVAIQQQASDSQGLEAIKQKRMVPTVATLSDSKYTARDADLVLGLFDPSKFGLPSWLGYKISDGLKSYARFLYVIANRNGEMGGVCPLFFDGAVCYFEELPQPTETQSLQRFYDKVQEIKSYRQQRKLSALTLLFLAKYGRKSSTTSKKKRRR